MELATLHSPEDNDATRKQIAEVKDMIADMEQRVSSTDSPTLQTSSDILLAESTTAMVILAG